MTNKTTKTITITLPLDVYETLKALPTSDKPQLEKFTGRKISNICTLLLTEKINGLNLD